MLPAVNHAAEHGYTPSGRKSVKAVVWTEYGPPEVLQLREMATPVPQADEVLIRICATSVTAGDCEMRSLKFPAWIGLPLRFYVGLSRPERVTILGGYLAGEIVAVGANVRKFRPGDQVFGATGFRFGTYAEYICLAEDATITFKPVNMTYAEAAAVPLGGLEALHFLRKANVQPGQKVLINGAGGSIGTFAVQLAKYLGAAVTAVDRTEKLEMMRELGADGVVDYTREDFCASGQKYDVVLDVVPGTSFSRIIDTLQEHGVYLLANPTLSKMLRGIWVSRMTNKKVIFELTSPNADDLLFLKKLIEAGKVQSIIDRQYALEQAAEAHQYIETGQKRGNVVITMEC